MRESSQHDSPTQRRSVRSLSLLLSTKPVSPRRVQLDTFSQAGSCSTLTVPFYARVQRPRPRFELSCSRAQASHRSRISASHTRQATRAIFNLKCEQGELRGRDFRQRLHRKSCMALTSHFRLFDLDSIGPQGACYVHATLCLHLLPLLAGFDHPGSSPFDAVITRPHSVCDGRTAA